MQDVVQRYPCSRCEVVLVFDAVDAELVGASEGARLALGRSAADSSPLARWFESAAGVDRERLTQAVREATVHGSASAEIGFERPDGSRGWLDLRFVPDRAREEAVVVGLGSDVTAAKSAESELERTRAFFEAAIRQSGIGIVMMQADAPAATIANRAAREILGVPEVDETAAIVDAAHWPEVRRNGVSVPVEDFPVVRAYTHGESVDSAEFEVVRGDSDLRTVLCSARPVTDARGERLGSIVLFPDITEWKRNAAYLQRRDRMLEIVHEQIRDAVFALDHLGRIGYVTPSLERMVGKGRELLLGRSLADSGLYDARDLDRAVAELERVLAGQAFVAKDFRFVGGSGEVRVGEVSGSPLRDERENPGALFVVRDVTERRLEEHHRAAREVQTRQRQKMEAVGSLAAGFAHEINNPLTGLVNLAELLELGLVPPPELPQLAGRMRSLCDRMTNIVRNLASFAGQDSAAMRVFSLADVVSSTLDLVAHRMKRSHIVCRFDPARGPKPLVRGRRGELQQLLLVLLSNACDAIEALGDGFPHRRRIDLEVDVVGGESGDQALLLVRDHGNGIEPEVAHRIFDPFFTTKAPARGGGLGLWVAFGIARDHGATLEAATVVGEGTTFRLQLPRVTSATEEA